MQENGNIPSWAVDWLDCWDFLGDAYDDLQWSAMFLEAQKS